MKIGVLGTGTVGDALASRLVELGHEVKMGSRTAGNEKAQAWVKRVATPAATQGTFGEAIEHGAVIINATMGVGSVEALRAGGSAIDGKVILDISNPLDFSKGMPPSLFVSNTDSLGETLQRTFPTARVVKSLNTMNANIMVNPRLLKGSHVVFMAGDDAAAKETVKGLLSSFGWKAEEILDLGGIIQARACESVLPIWLSVYMATKNPAFNFAIVT